MLEAGQTPQTDAEKQAVVEAAAKASQKDGGATDEVLSVLNQVLKREFKTRDEAVKSLDNLNRMVGDNAIAELRKRAQDSDNFEAIVSAYAENENLTKQQAREDLLKEIQKTSTKTEVPSSEKNMDNAVLQEVKSLKMKLQEKELLEIYPEAKSILKELKDLSQIYSGKELKEIYETSALRDTVRKVADLEKEKGERETTAVKSTARQVNFQEEKMGKLIEGVKKRGFDEDKIGLVEAYIEQLTSK